MMTIQQKMKQAQSFFLLIADNVKPRTKLSLKCVCRCVMQVTSLSILGMHLQVLTSFLINSPLHAYFIFNINMRIKQHCTIPSQPC